MTMNDRRVLLDLSSESESENEEFSVTVLLANNKRNWLSAYVRQREYFGEFHTLVRDLTEEQFKNYFRLSRSQFEDLHNTIAADIRKKSTNWRKPIGSQEKLAVCLRYMATGNSFKSLEYSNRLGYRSVARIVSEVCDAIWLRLQPTEMPEPTTEQLKLIAEGFKKKWNFDHCIGALDGKHVQIKAPPNSGSSYFNYKKTFLIVLLALVDANYAFTMVDVGAKGRFSDCGIFSSSFIGERLKTGQNIPLDDALYVGGEAMPYVAVADEAFPLLKHVMHPYPGKNLSREHLIYNYRLSRARRVVENVFGILATRWRVFYKPFEVSVEIVDKVVKATCILHNYLITRDVSDNIVHMNEVQPDNMIRLRAVPTRSTKESFDVRDSFMRYFNSQHCEVPWQWNVV